MSTTIKTVVRSIVVILVLTLSIAPALPAVAATQWVQAYQATGIWYGVYSSNYVMQNPTVQPSSWKVNAVFCTRFDGRSFTEVGWVKYGWDSHIWHFVAWKNNGVYDDRDFGTVTPGTNHTYGVRWMADTTKWRFYIDGVARHDQLVPDITSAIVATNAETHDTADSNYGHWWSLQYWDKNAAQWKLWTDLRQYKDNDPNYNLRKVTNTECYSQHI
ncbi:MAG: hypothetical protein IBX64_11450 [Actinobacteria bacterium]|nr:hypothetical protein [Actinomycetota bacterium]